MKALYVSSRDPVGPVRLARRPIAEIMSRPVVTVSAHALLDEALIQMIRTGLRHLAVVDHDGRCVGVLSDRAIAATWAMDYGALTRRLVASAIDPEPTIVRLNAAVADAARLMHATGVDAVAVVDDEDRPAGIVTGSDMVSLLSR